MTPIGVVNLQFFEVLGSSETEFQPMLPTDPWALPVYRSVT
jgi:hypothetical protein